MLAEELVQLQRSSNKPSQDREDLFTSAVGLCEFKGSINYNFSFLCKQASIKQFLLIYVGVLYNPSPFFPILFQCNHPSYKIWLYVKCVRLYVDIKIYFTEYNLMENLLSLLKKKNTSCVLAFFFFFFF